MKIFYNLCIALTLVTGMSDTLYSNALAFGHRGCRNLLPENTMAGFKHALEMGADGVELDVHLTKDGHVIVHHDYILHSSLVRTASGSWVPNFSDPIHSLTLEELKSHRLGKIKPNTLYAFLHQRAKRAQNAEDEEIPTLGEVLEMTKEYPNTRVLIEIKTNPTTPELSSDPELLSQAVVKVINESEVKDRCTILAFDAQVLRHIKALDQELPIFLNQMPHKDSKSPYYAGYDLKDFKGSAPAMIAKMGANGWSALYKQLNAENVKEAHDLGLKVYAWTVNSPKEMKRLLNIGVDGIISDRPDLLLQKLR